VRSVVRVEFSEDVRNVPFDGILTNGKFCADLLVRVAGRDQPQHLNFADSQSFFTGLFGQLDRYLGVNPPMPGMD
jgi:hypothetical protein